MEYQAVISEAWKLFKSGKKYIFYILGITVAYTIILFLIGIIGGLSVGSIFGTSTLLNSSTIANSATRTTLPAYNTISPALSPAFGILIIVILFVALLGGIFMWIFNTGIYKAFVEKFQSNKDMSFSEVFKIGLKYFLKVFITQLLLSLPFIAVFGLLAIVATGLGIGTYTANSNSAAVWGGLSIIVICFGSLLFIPLFLCLAMMNMAIQNAILLDGKETLESLSYSLKFIKKHFWKILLLMVIAIIIWFVVSIPLFCVNLSLGFLQGILSFGESATRGGSVSFAGSFVSFISQSIQTIYTLVLSMYFTCYWIVAYVKLKKLGETEVKPTEPIMA